MIVESYLKHEPHPGFVLSLRFALAVLTITVGAFFLPVNDVRADVYSDLPAAERALVDTRCMPIQYADGAAAFRECVIEQAQTLADSVGTPRTRLSFDEQFAVEQQCQGNGEPGTAGFQQCANDQINSLQGVPASDLSQVTDDEQYAMQQSCYSTQTTGGARAYRECINDAVSRLLTIPRPDLSQLSLLDKNALQLRCSANHDEAAAYRSCLLDAVNGATATPIVSAPTVSTEESVNTESPALNTAGQNQADNEASVPELPALAESTIEQPVAPDSTSLAPETSALATPSIDSSTVDATPQVVEDVAIAQNTEQNDIQPTTPSQIDTLELAANDAQTTGTAPEDPATASTDSALSAPLPDSTQTSALSSDPANSDPALPAATSPEPTEISPDAPADTGALSAGSVLEKARATVDNLWLQLQASLSGLSGINKMVVLAALALPLCLIGFWMLMRGRTEEPEYQPAPYPNPLIDRVGPSQQRRERANTARPDLATHVETQDFADQVDELFADDTPTRRHPITPNHIDEPPAAPAVEKLDVQTAQVPADRGPIGPWLQTHAPETQLSLAIEFMIYWTAYADERFDPELKQKIFELKEPDQHDLIKRWVLKQDVQAFADITRWLQSQASQEQRLQVLALLMALLVSENALTPAQNTLLRFLGDAFGAGHERLDELFMESYGQPMPPLPRADKPHWWDQQSMDDLKRWDARSVSRQAPDIQYRVKLGLPLTGDLSPQQIEGHYQRAAARCNPENINLLTRREQLLLERQLVKFEHARSSLLEVIA